MPRTILEPSALAAWQAATSQTSQIAALTNPFGGGNMTVRYMAGGTIAETATHGAPVNAGGTPMGAEPGALLASTVNVSGATITHAIWRTAGGVDILQIDAADLALASPTTQTGRRTNGADAVRPKMRVTADAGLPVNPPAPVVPTTATLSGSASATTAVAQTYTVTLDVAADQTYTITWARSNGGTGPATSVITAGQTSVSASSTWAAAGSARTIDFTISPSLTRAGRPRSVDVADPPAGFAWAISDASTLNTGRNTTTQLATDVPSGATFYSSPDLLPGQSLVLDGTTLNLVGDATVPTVDGAASGSAIDAISARDVVIEVIENVAAATVVNVTRGITYPYGTSYAGRTAEHANNRWNAVMTEANANDIIEVSPGAIQCVGSDAANYFNSLDSSLLSIWKPITLRGMSGRGRWRLFADRSPATGGSNGITIHSPADIYTRGVFVISDFEADQWGKNGNSFGFRVRSNVTETNTWADYHESVTVCNFKMGKPAYERSASCFSGNAETWTIEDGHVYDTGNGLFSSFVGADHNFYIGGRYLYMRGVRSQRSRAMNADGSSHMDGHQAKLTFNYATIEGSVFDCGPDGDSSIQIQMKGGGNLVVRGCLLIAGRNSQTATGNIVFEREDPGVNDGKWTYGLAGHSVLVERNTFVNHRPYNPGASDQRAFVYFRPVGHGWDIPGAAVTVQDNIGISTVPASIWIANSPDGSQGAWTVRNTARAYNSGEWAFLDRELLLYRDALGAPSAWGGSASVPQFLWPHGYRNVTRSTQGLG